MVSGGGGAAVGVTVGGAAAGTVLGEPDSGDKPGIWKPLEGMADVARAVGAPSNDRAWVRGGETVGSRLEHDWETRLEMGIPNKNLELLITRGLDCKDCQRSVTTEKNKDRKLSKRE